MTTPERKFLVGVWRALSDTSEGSSSRLVHAVAAAQGLTDWTMVECLRNWTREGWWTRDRDRLALLSSGRFTPRGAQEVGYQAAVLVQEEFAKRQADPPAPPPPTEGDTP